MVDPDGDGIYTTTLQRDAGFSSHYTFLNGNCPGWDCKENLAGLPCGDAANFNDRFLPELTGDVVVKACFGTCQDDGGCTIVTDSINITFMLNTANITPDPNGIFIAGGGNFGNPGDNPMIDPEGDGIYTFTSRRPAGFVSFYTFLNGNCPDWSCKEDLEGLPCADPLNFNDRLLMAGTEDMTIQACFGTCDDDGTCQSSSVNGLAIDENLFTLNPSLVRDFTNIRFNEATRQAQKEIIILDAIGQIVYTTFVENTDNYQINTTNYTNGLYFINVKTDEAMLTKKFMVQR